MDHRLTQPPPPLTSARAWHLRFLLLSGFLLGKGRSYWRGGEMGTRSKDLLRLEHNNASSSAIESALLVFGQKESAVLGPNPDKKPSIGPLPTSQVLGKVKDFLGVLSESNRRLELDAKENSDAYDIEVLSGNETNVIEMDLMLGIADLNTPEAVAAAESAIAGYQPVVPLAACTSRTESDYSSDSTNSDEEGGSDDQSQGRSKADSSSKGAQKKQSNKRQKIIELS